jgi:DNA-binding IclR family transcriptional regulator
MSKISVPSTTSTPRGIVPGADIDHRLFLATIEKGMVVLQTFCTTGRPMSLADVAAETGFNKSSVQRILYTLRMLNYLAQDEQTKLFCLTPRTLDIGNAYIRGNSAIEATFPYLLEANRKIRETINLSLFDGTEIVIVSRVHSRDVLSSYVVIGTRLPGFATAPGRAMLAFMEPDRINDVLDRTSFDQLTPHTKTNRAEIEAELEKIRIDGYAIADQETILGDVSVAVPVLGPNQAPLAAINAAAPTLRWPPEKIKEQVVPVLIDTVRRISKFMLHQI